MRKVESSSQKSKSSKRVAVVHKEEGPDNNQKPALLLARNGLNKSQVLARSRAAGAATAGEQNVAPMPDEVPPTSGLDLTPAGQIFSGENPSKPNVVDTFAKKICDAWYRTVSGILMTAWFCVQADAELSSDQKAALVSRLPFGDATFSKLLKIGRDARLQRPENQPRLPPSYTILYLIATLDDDEFQQAIELKVVHAEVNRSELEKWRRQRRDQAQHARDAQGAGANDANIPNSPVNEVAEQGAESRAELAPVPSRSEVQSGSDVPQSDSESAGNDVRRSPPIAPVSEECRSLSSDEQLAFDALVAAYDAAPEIVKDRFTSMVLQPAYGRRHVRAI